MRQSSALRSAPSERSCTQFFTRWILNPLGCFLFRKAEKHLSVCIIVYLLLLVAELQFHYLLVSNKLIIDLIIYLL